MKEYDIFLKKQLTEGKIIVYSLPFRDGVSAVNRTILQAVLSYLQLQKKFAVENESVLVAELDDMLATVSEKTNNEFSFDASTEITIKYRSELEKAVMELDIPALALLAQSLFAFESQIGIQISQPFAYVKSSMGSGRSDIVVDAESLAEQKRVFENTNSDAAFDVYELMPLKRDYEKVENAAVFDQTSPDLLYRYTTGLDAAFSIAAAIGETEFHYSLGNGESTMIFEASEPETFAEKKLRIDVAIESFYSLVVETISIFDVSNSTAILASLAAGLKRYRLLSELDDKTLAEVDGDTLNELDYVILA